jgi:hypothetical protein
MGTHGRNALRKIDKDFVSIVDTIQKFLANVHTYVRTYVNYHGKNNYV